MKKLFLPAVMLISLSLMSFAYLPDDEDEREKVRAAVLVSGQVSEDIKSNIGSAEIYPVSILNAEKFLSLEKLEDAVSEERQWHIIYGSTDVTVSRETGWRVTGFAELSESLPTAESCAAEGLDICVVYVPGYGARRVLSGQHSCRAGRTSPGSLTARSIHLRRQRRYLKICFRRVWAGLTIPPCRQLTKTSLPTMPRSQRTIPGCISRWAVQLRHLSPRC